MLSASFGVKAADGLTRESVFPLTQLETSGTAVKNVGRRLERSSTGDIVGIVDVVVENRATVGVELWSPKRFSLMEPLN